MILFQPNPRPYTSKAYDIPMKFSDPISLITERTINGLKYTHSLNTLNTFFTFAWFYWVSSYVESMISLIFYMLWVMLLIIATLCNTSNVYYRLFLSM